MSDVLLSVAASMGVAGTFLALSAARRQFDAAAVRARLGASSSAALPARERRPLLDGLARALEETRAGARLAAYGARVHPSLPFSDLLALAVAGVIGGGLSGWLLFGGGPLAVLSAIGGPVAVDRVMVRIGGRRALRLEQQLPDALALAASALRAGHSLVRALRVVADETRGPLGDEVRRTIREIDLGRSLDHALAQLDARAGSKDVELWVTAMLVHRQTGGNLASIVDALGDRIRERARLRSEIRALTAQGRLSGIVVAAAPLAFFLLLSVTSREQMAILYSTPLGLLLLAAGLTMEAAGFLWIRFILRIKL